MPVEVTLLLLYTRRPRSSFRIRQISGIFGEFFWKKHKIAMM
jgi:hypothetical protein